METPWNVLRVFHDPSMTLRSSGRENSVRSNVQVGLVLPLIVLRFLLAPAGVLSVARETKMYQSTRSRGTPEFSGGTSRMAIHQRWLDRYVARDQQPPNHGDFIAELRCFRFNVRQLLQSIEEETEESCLSMVVA